MERKIYECVINEQADSELEVSFVALVDRPAIEKNFLAFNEIKPAHFAIDEDRRIISGPAMIADLPIYRKDADFGEYYVTFSKKTIMSIVQKFFKKGFIQNFNLFHEPGSELSGITIFESFVVDSDRGVSPMKGFEDAPDGSWFISAKIDNDEVWNKVKSGDVKGFSVEGIFQYVKMDMQQFSAPEKLSDAEILEQIKKLFETQAN